MRVQVSTIPERSLSPQAILAKIWQSRGAPVGLIARCARCIRAIACVWRRERGLSLATSGPPFSRSFHGGAHRRALGGISPRWDSAHATNRAPFSEKRPMASISFGGVAQDGVSDRACTFGDIGCSEIYSREEDGMGNGSRLRRGNRPATPPNHRRA